MASNTAQYETSNLVEIETCLLMGREATYLVKKENWDSATRFHRQLPEQFRKLITLKLIK